MKRLSKKQMIIFSIGQLGWSILSGIINAWLVTFYLPTQADISENAAVQYIQPGLIILGFLTILGLITALSRIFDAITDPLIANISDRSRNKRGRRIPFMQYAAIPLSVVTVLLFCAPVEAISGINVLWISVFIVLFYLFMTMYCTPYNALISEFGKTQDDRMFISTAISLTFFAGTLLAYTPFVFAGMLRNAVGFGWSYRICFIVLAVVACVCMLLPTFLLKEKEFVDTKPSTSNMFKSLAGAFKNRAFRVFIFSDFMYWIGLTLFQTGLPFFVKVSMGIDESWTMIFMGGMTILSACFYPIVGKLVKKFGKKKTVMAAFVGLALAYVVAALIPILPDFIPAFLPGVLICIMAALPMARLGIIPQSMVADIAEADAIKTGENKEGMFFAARTFAMKWGQSFAMLIFTSLAIIGVADQVTNTNDITASVLGMTLVAITAVVFCVAGAVILLMYDEKRIEHYLNMKNGNSIGRRAEMNKEDEGSVSEDK
ncbi:MAG: MFS transporter [Clostridia bacterium]|nr:MFS transporter [Clostridia bacterium]